MKEVLKFIQRFKFEAASALETVFTEGNCYYFAIILHDRFGGEIYYLPIDNHFICKIRNSFYDIKGLVNPEETPIKWSDMPTYDAALYKRIVRDCMLLTTEEDLFEDMECSINDILSTVKGD